jgi:hypothetical protein
VDHDTQLLMSSDLRAWLQEDYLVHFIREAVGLLDVRKAKSNERGTGSHQRAFGELSGQFTCNSQVVLLTNRKQTGSIPRVMPNNTAPSPALVTPGTGLPCPQSLGRGVETPRQRTPLRCTLFHPPADQIAGAIQWRQTVWTLKNMKRCLTALLLCLGFLVHPEKAAADRETRYEVEAGVLSTRTMDLHGFHQSNATKGWDNVAPALRLEAWSVKPDGWNFGGVLQPIYLKYSDRLSSDWTAKGKDFHKGNEADLTYQFHSIRGTANYPVLMSLDRESYLRLGVSGILRYADVRFGSAGQTHHGTNLIGFPLLNVEGKVPLSKSYSLFTRSDLLPSPTGDVFLDGLFDVFAGVRKTLSRGSTLDVGVRLFFGGYDPDRKDDYGNRIFLNGLVVRYSW